MLSPLAPSLLSTVPHFPDLQERSSEPGRRGDWGRAGGVGWGRAGGVGLGGAGLEGWGGAGLEGWGGVGQGWRGGLGGRATLSGKRARSDCRALPSAVWHPLPYM